MNPIWWRAYLRRLPDLGIFARLGTFHDVDELIPFVMESLDPTPMGRILDLGCGSGAFSVRLAQWGYQVTAVEDSEAALAEGAKAAGQRGVEVEFRRSGLAELPERARFDGALMLDFGSYPDVENAQIMRTVASALKPGARLVFGTCNPYYWARRPVTEHQVIEGVDVVSRYSFDFDTGSVVSRMRAILPDGGRRDLPAVRYRSYTLSELRALTVATGLADFQAFGEDEEGSPTTGKLDPLGTRFFHCSAVRPMLGESGEGI